MTDPLQTQINSEKEYLTEKNVELVKFSTKNYRLGNGKAHLSRTSKYASLIATTSEYDGIRTKLVTKKNIIISNCECESSSNTNRLKTEKHLAIINNVN